MGGVRGRALLAATVFGVAVVLWLAPRLRGDDHARPAAPRGAATATQAPGALSLIAADAQCAGCAPEDVTIAIEWSEPVDRALVARSLQIWPSVALTAVGTGASLSTALRGAFRAEQTYTVRIPATVTSVHGKRLAAPFHFTFRTGPHTPVARMPVGQAVLPPGRGLPVQLAHVRAATLRVVRLEPGDLEEAAQKTGVHEAGTDPLASLPPRLRRRVVERRLAPDAGDADGIQEVDVFALAGGPLALVTLQAPGTEPRAVVAQRGELSAVMKIGQKSSLVWVADTVTGLPVAGADVAIYDGADLRAQARTDAAGIARLGGRERLELPRAEVERRERAAQRRRRDTAGAVADVDDGGDEEWHGDPQDWESDGGDPFGGRPLRAVVRAGARTAFASTRFTEGLEPWQYGLANAWSSGPEALRGMVTAERGIYRPGEPVHLLAMLRRRDPSGRLVPARGLVQVSVTDPDGTTVFDERVRPTAFGTVTLERRLPTSARLGRYVAKVQSGTQALYGFFEVGAYRTPTFEVKLPPVGAAERDADGAVVVPVRAAYYYGAPVRGGRLAWSASWRPRVVTVRGLEGFSFGDPERATLRALTSGEATLGDDGTAIVRVPADALPRADDPAVAAASAYDLVIEASVMDPADDTVSASAVQTVTRSPLVVGVRNDRWVVDAALGWDVQVVAVDTAAAADAAATRAGAASTGTEARGPRGRAGRRLVAELLRRVWVTVAEEGSDGYGYGGRYEDRLVRTQEVRSAAGPVALHLDLPGAGDFTLRVRDAETGVTAHAHVWAWGAGEDVGPARAEARVALRADAERYAPGDTARIVVASPFARSTALVTVEREGVLDARVATLDGAATPVDVPLGERHMPNAFVSVTLLSRTGAPLAGPPLRMGYLELEVRPESRRLAVKVEPARATMQPGERAEVLVTVTDAAGRPVRGEVTLWAADEGVLALTGYQTPDPFAPAHAPLGLRMQTASNLVRWTTRLPDTWDEPGVGDGGPEEESTAALRSRFLTTAFFSRPVATDARGRARVTFDLPDNLTRWRVMAAACDAGDRFGKGESAIRARKPLQVMPSLPRFLVEGDVVEAGVVVHDDTERDGDVEVRFEASGAAELVGGGAQRLSVGPGGQAATRVRLRATGTGEVTVRAFASKGGARDGFEVRLPVHAPTPWQSVQVGDGLVDGSAKTTVTLPAGVAPGNAALYVTVAPSALAALERGLESLIEYPNGCVEQTTSRLIPMVLLEDLLRDLGSDRLASEEHRRKMAWAIDHVLEHQNDDGGFGLWPPSPSEGFLTAYALWGLMTARDHGHEVPAARIDRGLAYLAAHATQGDDTHGQFSSEETAPFAAFVLAQGRRDDRGLGAELVGRREALTRFGVGLLASALERREADATALLGDLVAARRPAARGGQLVADPRASERGGFLSFGRDLRASASAVQALVAAGRVREADDLVAGILSERTPDGSWGSTYNNLWALQAVSTYAAAVPKAQQSAVVVVKLGGREVGRLRLDPRATARRLEIPYAELVRAQVAPGGPVLEVLAPAAARLRYSARLRYAQDVAHHRPASRGMTVSRELRDAETGAVVTTPHVGQLLRVVVRVQLDAEQRQVALTDRLPGGLEPVDTALRTEAQRAAALAGGGGGTYWTWRELHDERAAFFADVLRPGLHEASYLARATRAGEFVRPPAAAEAMYDPTVGGVGPAERVVVRSASPTPRAIR
jgi:uncharacterized protein YfaS (alpha-2-macroglobulin family)